MFIFRVEVLEVYLLLLKVVSVGVMLLFLEIVVIRVVLLPFKAVVLKVMVVRFNLLLLVYHGPWGWMLLLEIVIVEVIQLLEIVVVRVDLSVLEAEVVTFNLSFPHQGHVHRKVQILMERWCFTQ